MHKLEITGTTPEELLMNALRMLTVLLNGGAQPTPTVAAEQSRPESSYVCPDCGEPQFDTPSGVTCNNGHGGAAAEEIIPPASNTKNLVPAMTSEEIIPPAAAKGKRGRPRNADKASEAPADLPTEKVVELNDDISDVGGKPAETVAERALTLNDDIKPRLQAIQKACTARGLDMASTVNYILKLYGPFGITKADQLKPEQFAEFLEASEAYLSGEA